MKKTNLYFKSNDQIRANELRVIGSDGKQLGVITYFEAQKLAKAEKLDLVLIAENAKPPVAKIVNLGKFIYQEEKKLKKQKTKSTELKEIRFSPFIGEADYETRLKRVKEFLDDKDKVKLAVVFKGKQLGSKAFGYGLLDKVVKSLGETVHVDSEPKFFGRHLSMIISPRTKRVSVAKEVVKEGNKKDAKTEDTKVDNKEV